MPAAASATVGLFSCARRIASLNVTRTTGAGACALAAWPQSSARIDAVAREATAERAETAERNLFGALCGVCACFPGLPLHPTTSDALDDHIQNRNERQIQEGRRD